MIVTLLWTGWASEGKRKEEDQIPRAERKGRGRLEVTEEVRTAAADRGGGKSPRRIDAAAIYHYHYHCYFHYYCVAITIVLIITITIVN